MSGRTSDPELSFGHIYETEACCDEGWVEVSTDGGITWTKLEGATTASSWYNDSANGWWDGSSGGAWQTARHPVTGGAGQARVRIRFVMRSDGSVTREGFGIDDLTLTP
jgi:hypothetical protein